MSPDVLPGCLTCGEAVDEMSPEMRAAKKRLGLPLTHPKRCSKCVWLSLLKLAESPDEEDTPSNSTEIKP